MKMNEQSYKRFTDFYNFVVATADDKQVEFLMDCMLKGADARRKGIEVNYKNPSMCEENYNTIKEFFVDFLNNATDDDAIYLIEGLKALCKEMIEHTDRVDKFILRLKKAAAKKSN